MSATATTKPAPKAEPKPPTFKDVQALEEGEYRVTFEGRSTWTATLVQDDGPVLRYEGTDAKQRRDFPLKSAGGGVGVKTKPKWGALTKIVAAV